MGNTEKENKKLKVVIVILVITLFGISGYHYYTAYVQADDKNKEVEDKITDNIVIENSKDNISLDFDMLSNYRNDSNNNYGDIEYFYEDWLGIRTYLSADGNVRMIKDGSQKEQKIENLTNVVDIKNFCVLGECTYYFLSDDGNVYSYNLNNFEKESFTASKENVSDVGRIVHYRYSDTPGSTHLLIAITKNGENIILKRETT